MRLLPLLVLVVPLVVRAEEIELTSDSLSLHPGSRNAVAEGNVVARSPTFEVQCAKAEATYAAGERRTLETLVLLDGVRVRRTDGVVATSERATWTRSDGKLVLDGSPVVERGVDVIRGERITFVGGGDEIGVERPRVVLADERERPVKVQAGKLTLRDDGRKARFEKDVRIDDGRWTSTSDRADAVLSARGEQRTLASIALQGHVEARRGTQHATAERAHWDAQSGDVVLEGKPVVRDGTETIEGERIVLQAATGKARVETATIRLKRTR